MESQRQITLLVKIVKSRKKVQGMAHASLSDPDVFETICKSNQIQSQDTRSLEIMTNQTNHIISRNDIQNTLFLDRVMPSRIMVQDIMLFFRPFNSLLVCTYANNPAHNISGTLLTCYKQQNDNLLVGAYAKQFF